jgi:hypothetical protein
MKPTVHVYIDESGTHEGSSRILVGAVATTANADLADSIRKSQGEALATAHHWQGNNDKRSRFARVGYHYTEDLPSIQDSLLAMLPKLSFRAHVIYSQRALRLSDEEIQIASIALLLLNTARRYKAFQINYIFEEDSAKNSLYGKLISYAAVHTGHKHITGFIASKPDPGVSVVDYVIGIASDYLDQDSKQAFRRHRFDSLQPHLAHVLDLDTALHLSGGHGRVFL